MPDQPPFTPVPNVILDEWLTLLADQELRVLLYVLRRTKGFRKDSDAISLTQFTHGITTADGRVIDQGSGVKSRGHVNEAIKSLQQKGLLQIHKHLDSSGRKAANTYSVVVPAGHHIVPTGNYQSPDSVVPAGNRTVPRSGQLVVPVGNRQKKVQKKGERRGATQKLNQLWGQVLASLETQMTAANYQTWLAETHPVGTDGAVLVVAAPSAYVRDWLQNRFRALVRKHLKEINSNLDDVTFELSADAKVS
jgi:hypothetical protein